MYFLLLVRICGSRRWLNLYKDRISKTWYVLTLNHVAVCINANGVFSEPFSLLGKGGSCVDEC